MLSCHKKCLLLKHARWLGTTNYYKADNNFADSRLSMGRHETQTMACWWFVLLRGRTCWADVRSGDVGYVRRDE